MIKPYLILDNKSDKDVILELKDRSKENIF